MVNCPGPCRERATQRGEAMPISPGVRDAIRQGSWIRKMFADSLHRTTGLPFALDHVIMSTGAAGALNVALRAILSPGDEVLVIAPYFVEYLYYIRNAGGIPVVAESKEDFQRDMGAIRAALSDRPKDA